MAPRDIVTGPPRDKLLCSGSDRGNKEAASSNLVQLSPAVVKHNGCTQLLRRLYSQVQGRDMIRSQLMNTQLTDAEQLI